MADRCAMPELIRIASRPLFGQGLCASAQGRQYGYRHDAIIIILTEQPLQGHGHQTHAGPSLKSKMASRTGFEPVLPP